MSLTVEESLAKWNEKFDDLQNQIDENSNLSKHEFIKWYLQKNDVVKDFIANHSGNYGTLSIDEGSEVYKRLLPRHFEIMKKFHKIYFGEDLLI